MRPSNKKTKKAPPSGRHLGPRPLPLHLAAPMFAWMSLQGVLLPSRSGWTRWNQNLVPNAEALREGLADVDLQAFRNALDGVASRQFSEMLAGILTYRRHPYHRTLPEPPIVWRSGAACLYDYGTEATAKAKGVPVLFIPSLINRSYVLDLSKRTSMLRYLADHGIWPFLIDWGKPGSTEQNFTLTDYIAGVLEGAFKATQSLAGKRIAIVGYCMGGLLALALALRQRKHVPGLALLATPWDFHATEKGEREGQTAKKAFESIAPLVDALGEMPVDVLQSFFLLLNPFQAAKKFRIFASLDPNSVRAQDFVALEDWVNDGTALAAPVARECLLGWYGDNTTARGEWKVAGRKVHPETFDVPSLVCIPSQDYIVSPASARALAEVLPCAESRVVSTGHIGMAVGTRAKTELWQPLAKWLESVYAI